ncbi:MAG TPA: glutamate racemase [Gemmatimonadaceae bacterium]
MTIDPSAPIGVFDSGIGGLTVVREIMRQLPEEDIIYFGDTARVPYGPKSPETVTRYAHEITSFLRDQGVKNVVVACNTATAHAVDSLREHFDLPITGVIEPGARAAVRASSARRVGVVGTLGTVSSGAYERAIHALDESMHVTARACPLFVPFVEEGWLDHPALGLVAQDYLTPLRNIGIDAVVLGCTHYPLIKGVIARTLGPDIRLIDSAEETAGEVARLLAERGLRRPPRSERPQLRFIASDVPEQFRNVGKRFLGAAIDQVETITLG